MDKLAHAWFGIPKDIASYTRPGLDAVRKVPRARPLYCAATSRAPLQSFRVVQQRFCVHSGGAGWQRQSGPTHDKHT